MEKTNVRVYDWPVRIFHWAFVVLFIASFFIANYFDDDAAQFPYHMLFGINLAFLVILRIFWGLIGTQYARFNSYKLSPKDLLQYLQDLFNKNSKVYTGHNPASSWAAVVMMLCALGLAVSGHFMVNGEDEMFEEVHEILANLFLITAILHVAGIIFHTIKHRDQVGLSMITGRKMVSKLSSGIEKNYLSVGLILLLATVFFGNHLWQNYDPIKKELSVFGTTHVLGKIELHENEGDDSEDED